MNWNKMYCQAKQSTINSAAQSSCSKALGDETRTTMVNTSNHIYMKAISVDGTGTPTLTSGFVYV